MITLIPYLLFNGNGRQAMEFYHSCFGGDLTLVQVKDSPAKEFMPPTLHERLLNARLKSGNLELSASDWLRPDQTRTPGNTVCLYLHASELSELTSIFEVLAQDGEVTDPLKEVFFGTYGALNDKFGVRWMFHTTATPSQIPTR